MASTDFFLKIDGIPGESNDKTHKDEIDVLSFSWGASNTGTSSYGGGAGSGKVNIQDFHFTMKYNKASSLLFLNCANGKHIGKAVLSLRKSTGDGGQKEYMVYTFSDIVISSYQTGASGGGDPIPTESVSFNFAKVEMAYKPQDSKGALGAEIKHGWDVKLNDRA